MGLFTAYHASERFGRVAVLERGRVGDPATASYGRTRSFRSDYLDATYARLAHEAFRLWGEFEAQTATRGARALRLHEHRQARGHARPRRHLRAAEPRDADAARACGRSRSTAPRCARASPTSTPTSGASTSTPASSTCRAVTDALTRDARRARGRACSRASSRSRSSATARRCACTPAARSSPPRSLVVTAGHGTNDVLALLPGCTLRVPITKDRPERGEVLRRRRPPTRELFTSGAMPVIAYLDTGIYCHPIVDGLVDAVKIGYYNPPDMPHERAPAIDSIASFVEQCLPGPAPARRSRDVEDVDQCDYDLVADDDFVLGAGPGRRRTSSSASAGAAPATSSRPGSGACWPSWRSRAAPSTTSPASTRPGSEKGRSMSRPSQQDPAAASRRRRRPRRRGLRVRARAPRLHQGRPVRARGDPRRARRAAPAAPRVPARGRRRDGRADLLRAPREARRTSGATATSRR